MVGVAVGRLSALAARHTRQLAHGCVSVHAMAWGFAAKGEQKKVESVLVVSCPNVVRVM